MVWVKRLDTDHLKVAGEWLSREEVYKWLDFGAGVQKLSAVTLAVMAKRDLHDLRVYGLEGQSEPIGIVAISDISSSFGSGTLWYVLGDQSYGGKGYTSRAVGIMLDRAFGKLGMTSIDAWVVANNLGSIRILEKNGFQRIGYRRMCHRIGDKLLDRVYFDKLASEHAIGGPVAPPRINELAKDA